MVGEINEQVNEEKAATGQEQRAVYGTAKKLLLHRDTSPATGST